MADITHTSGDSFDVDVIQSTQPVLVDFTAIWCGPCKMLDPIVRQLAEEWGERARVMKLDVDHNPELAMNYGVMGVPTLMLFKGGEPVERLTGYQPKDRLLAKFGPHI